MEDSRGNFNQTQPGLESFEDIVNSMSSYFNNREMSDVIIKLEDTRYYAHKFVLGLLSDVFRTMCSRRWEGDQTELELQECEECVPVFTRFLKFLYCGDIDVDLETALPLLMLADKYNVKPLKQNLVQYMKKTVKDGSVTAALRWLSYSQVSGHGALQSACLDVVITKMDEVVASDDYLLLELGFLISLFARDDLVILWEKTIFDAIVLWIQAQHEVKDMDIKALLSLIRLPMMSPEQLYEIELSDFSQSYEHILAPMLAASHRFRSIGSEVCDDAFSGAIFRPRNYTHRLWCHYLTVDMNGETFYQNSVGVRCVNHPVLAPPEQFWQIRVMGEKRNSRTMNGHKPTVLPNLGYVFTPSPSMSEKTIPLVMTITPLRPIKQDIIVDVSLFQVKKDKVIKPLCESSIKFAPEEYFTSMDLVNGSSGRSCNSGMISLSPPHAGPPKFSPTPMNFAVMFQQSRGVERLHELTLRYDFSSQDLDHPPEVPCFKFNGPLRMTNSVRVAVIFKPRFVQPLDAEDLAGSSASFTLLKESDSGLANSSRGSDDSDFDHGVFPL